MKFKYLILFLSCTFGFLFTMQTKTMNPHKRKAKDISNHDFMEMEEDSNFLISEQQLKKYIYYKSHNILDDIFYRDIGTIILDYIYSETYPSNQEQKKWIKKIEEFILKKENDNPGNILLYALAQGYEEDVIQELIKFTTNFNATDKRGYPALYYALCGYSEKIVYQLIQAGADVNLTIDKQSLLQIALEYQPSLNIIMEFIKHGANPNIYIPLKNKTLLVWAINHQYIDLIKLIKDKVNINLVMFEYPYTALGHALNAISSHYNLHNQNLDKCLKNTRFKLKYNIIKELILADTNYSNFLDNTIIQSILKDEVLPCYKNNLEILPPVLTDIIMQYAIDPNYKILQNK